MRGLVYPLAETTRIYRELNSSYLPINPVKINVRDQSSCAFHAILMGICEEYQDARDEMKRKEISESFKIQFKNYLLSESTMSESAIVDRFTEAYERSNMKDKYRLKLSKDLFNTRLVKLGEPDYTSSRVSYLLFPKNMMTEIRPKSRIFELLSLEFLTKMMDQRYLLGLYSEKVMEMEKVLSEDTNYQMEDEVSKLRELMAFHLHKSNSLTPDNLIKLIGDDFCENQDILIRLLSESLKFNVFFCRAWSTEVSVIKEFRSSKSYPSVMIFKIDGKVSITGMNTGVIYETGGILSPKGIKTILDPKEDSRVIQILREIKSSEVDGFHMEKYHTYLGSMGEEDIQEEEDVELEVEEMSSEEEVEEEVETEMEQEEDLRNEEPIDVHVEIPAFIKGYSDVDLKTLLKTFTSSDGESMDRRGMEIMYSNYIRGQVE